MTCDTEIGRQLTATLIAQVTPFYIVTVVALVALGTVAIGTYRRKFSLPPVTRGIVALSLVGILVYGLWRIGYDRAYIASLAEMACRKPLP